MKRLALALLLLAAPTPAQFTDPCVSYNRVCSGSVCWWEWTYHQLQLRNTTHIEMVPTARGIGLVCYFTGGPASDLLIAIGQVVNSTLPAGCPDQVVMAIDAYWWLGFSLQGGLLTRCNSGFVHLRNRQVGFEVMGGVGMCSPSAYGERDDLTLTNYLVPIAWTRKPT